jgi:hypothetical protein
MARRLSRKQKAAVVVGTVGLLAAAGTGTAFAAGGDDDRPIEGDALEKAERAALAETGGGTVTETEVEAEGSAYEVEVDLGDGRQVDVQLDQDFQVVGSETEDASEDASENDSDDDSENDSENDSEPED